MREVRKLYDECFGATRELADERLAREVLYGRQARTSSHLVDVHRKPVPTWTDGDVLTVAGANAVIDAT